MNRTPHTIWLIGILYILALLSCKSSSQNINIQTQHFRYTFSSRGINQSFTDLATGNDYLYKDTVSHIAYVTSGNKIYPPDHVLSEEDKLVITFTGPGIVAYLSLKNEADYVIVSVDSVAGVADAFNFLNVPLTPEALPDEPFAACVLSLNLTTHVQQLPALQDHLWATCYKRFGINGASAAMLGVPRQAVLATIQKIVKTESAIPFSDKGGAWALNNKEGYGSYLMNFGSLTLQTVDEWIAKCDSLGFKQIAIHGANQFFLNGDLELFKDRWPGGWADFKKINARLHQAGISSILLTYAYFVDKSSALVSPVPSEDLGYFNSFTIANEIGEGDTEIVVNESTANVSTIVGYFIQNSTILRLGKELVTFSGVSQSPPYKFTGVKRGVLGTKPAKHSVGEKGFHLMLMFDQFVAGPETKLFDEIARKTARIVNENDFDGIYFDAIDGNNMLGGKENAWYYGSKFVVEVAKNLSPMVGMEMCDMPHHYWHYSSRWQAWDKAVRGYKRFVDVHLAALKSDNHRHGEWIGYTKNINRLAPVNNGRLMLPLHMGWWSNNTWESPQVETTFPDDIEYLLVKMIANDAGLSMLGGTDEQTLNEKPLFRKLVSLIKQYENIRHQDRVSEAVKAKLRQPGQEFTLKQKDDGEWAFKPVVYNKKMVIGDTASWLFQNPFLQQPLKLRIQQQMSAGAYDAADNFILSDAEDIESWVLDTVAAGVTSSLAVAKEKDGPGSRFLLKAENKTQSIQEATWVKWQKKFEPCINLNKQQGLGVWIKGDSSGALLNLRLESPKHLSMGARGDHFVTIDFSGWKYFELIEIESAAYNNYLWPDEYQNVYNSYFYKVKFDCIDKLQIWLNNIPPDKEVNIEVATVKALPLIAPVIENPVIRIGENSISFPVQMKPGMYLEFNSMEDCHLYNANGKYLKAVNPTGIIPVLKQGDNKIQYQVVCKDAVVPRLQVSVCAEGNFMKNQ